jgi:hypothetical protein
MHGMHGVGDRSALFEAALMRAHFSLIWTGSGGDHFQVRGQHNLYLDAVPRRVVFFFTGFQLFGAMVRRLCHVVPCHPVRCDAMLYRAVPCCTLICRTVHHVDHGKRRLEESVAASALRDGKRLSRPKHNIPSTTLKTQSINAT